MIETFLLHETRKKPINGQADGDAGQNNHKNYTVKLGQSEEREREREKLEREKLGKER